MIYKHAGISYSSNLDIDGVTIYLKDTTGNLYIDEDAYSVSINYSDYFYDRSLYDCGSIENCIEEFVHAIDSIMRECLPDSKEYNDYKEIEGYLECLGVIKENCTKPLFLLWNDYFNKEIDKINKIITKVKNDDFNFTQNEVQIILSSLDTEKYFIEKDRDGELADN